MRVLRPGLRLWSFALFRLRRAGRARARGACAAVAWAVWGAGARAACGVRPSLKSPRGAVCVA
eukprot:4732971-Prymnesium_polylepis.2